MTEFLQFLCYNYVIQIKVKITSLQLFDVMFDMVILSCLDRLKSDFTMAYNFGLAYLIRAVKRSYHKKVSNFGFYESSGNYILYLNIELSYAHFLSEAYTVHRTNP